MTNSSILDSIKKLLGLTEDYTIFDQDIIMHINTVLANLVQMGVGPSTGFVITGSDETWSDFIGDSKLYEQIKTYVYIKVKLVFDPPTSSQLLEAMNHNASELEWRMYVQNQNETEGGNT